MLAAALPLLVLAAAGSIVVPHRGYLSLVDTDGRPATRVYEPALGSGAYAVEPRFSPDGTRIAFEARDAVWVMRADGSDRRRVIDGHAPSWSPDGTTLVVWRIDHERGPGPGPPSRVGLWLVGADGTNPRIVPHDGSAYWPDWSPDGGRIAFTEWTADGTSIATVAPDGTGQQRLTAAGADIRPRWSPDGTRIAFTSSRDGDPGVYVMSADGSDQRRLTAWRGREEAGGWSPDGARLLLASARGQPTGPDLWMVNADGTCPTPLTRGGVAAGPAAWSPAAPPPGPLRCGPGDPPAPEPPAIAVPHFDRAGSSADPQGLRASGVRTWWLGERHGGLVLVRIHRIPRPRDADPRLGGPHVALDYACLPGRPRCRPVSIHTHIDQPPLFACSTRVRVRGAWAYRRGGRWTIPAGRATIDVHAPAHVTPRVVRALRSVGGGRAIRPGERFPPPTPGRVVCEREETHGAQPRR